RSRRGRSRISTRTAFADRLACPQPYVLSSRSNDSDEDDQEYRCDPCAGVDPACGSRHDQQQHRELDERVCLGEPGRRDLDMTKRYAIGECARDDEDIAYDD